MAKIKQFTTRLPEKIDNWLIARTEEIGTSKNALIVLALEEYIQQKDTLATMRDITKFFEKLESMESDIKKMSKVVEEVQTKNDEI